MLIILLIIFLVLFPTPALATETAGASGALKKVEARPDQRVEKLSGYLKSYNSPLAPFAEDFVQKADEYRIDWRLLPAIAGIESTFGKRMIAGSFNAYGWGGGLIRFQSWPDSIDQVSKALREKYYDRGLDTPYKINPVYCPPNKTWGAKVDLVMKKIAGFEPELSLAEIKLSL